METANIPYSYSFKLDTANFNPLLVKTKSYELNDVTYTILNTVHDIVADDNSAIRNYRSVVLDEDKSIICISPASAVDIDEFKKENPVLNNDSVYINEIVEGTMLNLFYDPRIKSWELASRGAIGGNYWFYRTQYETTEDGKDAEPSQKTFRQMFMDVFRCSDTDTLNDIPFIQSLSTKYIYSFVMQHPENHIVLPVLLPRLYLVSVFKVDTATNTVTCVSPLDYEHWDGFSDISGIIEFPKRYTADTYEDLTEQYASIHCDYSVLGVMLTNFSTGDRSAINNPAYEEVRALRGNNPNLQYQYFCLLRADKVSVFLKYFPTYTQLFRQFDQQYQRFITNVHQSYFSYYVKKEGLPIAKKFFVHVARIHHNLFIPSMANGGPKLIITRTVVKDHFETLTPSELIYYLNYDKRQIAVKRNDIVDMVENSEIVI